MSKVSNSPKNRNRPTPYYDSRNKPPSKYTIFLPESPAEKYSMIEMHHAKRRMTYVQPLNLLVVQIENIEKLRYLNITPDKILLTDTARRFDVKQVIVTPS